jgi:hypothetical protein
VFEEDRVPVSRSTRRPDATYVPYQPERRYMEDPSLPRFRSMLEIPTRQGPDEGKTKANPQFLVNAT